ncbi:MAG: DUF6125 family protein [Armatimonadota bacterium]|nr:DUF6125 family protein [Armatimonadota bacterium]
MNPTGSETVLQMLRRSYLAVDGLWFVMIEEEEGLERAMELDERVWQVMPKIQARKARELLGVEGRSPSELVRCMALKFAAEGHDFVLRTKDPREARVVIKECSWRAALRSADKMHLAPEIADRICATEGTVWAAEFAEDIEFELQEAMCKGGDCCRFVFRTRA